MDFDPVLRAGRRRRRRHHRLSDIPPARALFRSRDARLSARHALRLPVAWLPGIDAADEARGAAPLHAVRGPPRLCRACARPACRRVADLAQGREFTLRHVADGDQTERAGSRGGGHQYLALEDAGIDAVGSVGCGGRRALRGHPAGCHTGNRVRHAGFRAGADPRLVRRGRQPLGPGHRRGRARALGRGAQRRARRCIARHSGRRVRRGDHRDHPARARGGLLARPRPVLKARAGGGAAIADARSCNQHRAAAARAGLNRRRSSGAARYRDLVRRVARAGRDRPHPSRGRALRHNRPERRRQDDAVQCHQRVSRLG